MTTLVELRAVDALREFTDRDLEVLVGASATRRFPTGAALMSEGEAPRACFVVVSGEVEVVRAGPEGQRVLTLLGAGAIVGHMALVDRSPRSATVRALTPVTALELPRDAFERLLEACSPLAIRFQEQIALAGIRQLRRATERLLDVAGAQDPAQIARADEALRDLRSAAAEWSVPVERRK